MIQAREVHPTIIGGFRGRAWNEISVDLKDYRYLRCRGPIESFGNVAEIEFCRDGIKVDKALDGDLETFSMRRS